jgi:RNA polymerase sigma factor (sigma-70 family)
MLFAEKISKPTIIGYQPNTCFSKHPLDRWTNWTGILEKEDWKYICTESVYKYIFKATYKKCKLMRFDSLTCEEIAVSVTGETIMVLKNICQKASPEDRRIRKSIRALVNTISNKWLKNFLSRFYADTNLEHKFDMEDFVCVSSDAEEFTIRTEILSEVFKCIENLSDKSKAIIAGIFFEDRTLKTIATQMQIEQHKVNYIKEKAEKIIADCMKSKGFD